MNASGSAKIKAPGFALSGAAAFYLFFIQMGIMWGLLLLLILLTHFFPGLKLDEWSIAVLLVPVLLVFLLLMLSYFHTVILEPDGVTQKWFGISVRKIHVSRFQVFCALGNGREDVLCLSCYSAEELTRMEEERLLRSLLNKHNVPFRKRKAGWQDEFVRGYLNHLRKNPFRIFKKQEVVMLKMHPALQYAIRQMYPQLPYKNYTGVTSCHFARWGSNADNQAVSFPLLFYQYPVRMESDGIHISTKKEVSFIPAEQIRTVVRVDIFKAYNKYYPHHVPLLFVTSLSEEELAAKVPTKGYGGIRLNDANNQALLAMMAATELAIRWNASRKDCCVLYHTEKNLETLRTLYPHIQINEIAANWLNDAET